jgi:hypothetical protein
MWAEHAHAAHAPLYGTTSPSCFQVMTPCVPGSRHRGWRNLGRILGLSCRILPTHLSLHAGSGGGSAIRRSVRPGWKARDRRLRRILEDISDRVAIEEERGKPSPPLRDRLGDPPRAGSGDPRRRPAAIGSKKACASDEQLQGAAPTASLAALGFGRVSVIELPHELIQLPAEVLPARPMGVQLILASGSSA